MGREVKRVALDFEWPIDMLWKGYLNPYHSQRCEACDGQGYNAETKAIADAFYGRGRPGAGWCNSITQDEVQTLVDSGRLYDFTHTWSQGDGWQPKDPPVVPTAEQVNAWNAGPGFGHDGINRWILIEARAKRLGVYGKCSVCGGDGEIWASAEVKQQSEDWKNYDPPAGPGFQLWSATSEGHPMTPVFASAEALADYCVKYGVSSFGSQTGSREDWLRLCNGAFMADMIMDATGLHTGVVMGGE